MTVAAGANVGAVVRVLVLVIGLVLAVAGVLALRRGAFWGVALVGVGLLVAAAGTRNL